MRMKKFLIALSICFALALVPAFVLVGCGNGKKETATAGKKYAVTFVLDDTHKSVSLVREGAKAKAPVEMTKIGYNFDAWYANTEKTQVYDFSKPVKSNVTLYARHYDNKLVLAEDKSTAYVADCKGSLVSAVIPEIFDGKPVTAIGKDAFAGSSLQVLTIPQNITEIGANAFRNCADLISITIGNGVTQIGANAFKDCVHLNNVIIPNNVTSLGNYAFMGCTSLGNVILGNNLTTIGQGAFKNCIGISEITIPNSVGLVKDAAFSGCSSLFNIVLPYCSNSLYNIIGNAPIRNVVCSSSQAFSLFGCSSVETVYFREGITSLSSDFSFGGCGRLTSVIIENTVESLYDSRDNCNAIIKTNTNTLVKACRISTIPNSVKTIGTAAFQGVSVVDVVIPDNVEEIEFNAFYNCTSLKNIKIGSGVQTIANQYGNINNFGWNWKTRGVNRTVVIDCEIFSNITALNELFDYATKICVKKSIIDNGITNSIVNNTDYFTCIGEEDGYYVYVPYLFSDNGDGTVTLSEARLEMHENGAIANCSWDIEIPSEVNGKRVSRIRNAFFDAHIRSIIIPNGVEIIGDHAISRTDMTYLTIPSSVTEIGFEAFSENNNLHKVFYDGSIAQWCDIDFYYSDYTWMYVSNPIYLTREFYADGNLVTEILSSDLLGVVRINETAFYGYEKLTKVEVPSTVEEIGNMAFSGCYNLATVVIDSSAIYGDADGELGYDAGAGGLLAYATTVYILNSIDNGTNTYLNNNFTKSNGAGQWADYYIYTKN